MKHDWETDSTVEGLQEMAEDMHHKGFAVAGIVVWNSDTGEGALLEVAALGLDGVEKADVYRDALGDMTELYQDAVDGIYDA